MSQKIGIAAKVPKVPGARGASPLPKPKAKKWLGLVSRAFKVGLFMGEVLIALLSQFIRLTLQFTGYATSWNQLPHHAGLQPALGNQHGQFRHLLRRKGEAQFIVIATSQGPATRLIQIIKGLQGR